MEENDDLDDKSPVHTSDFKPSAGKLKKYNLKICVPALNSKQTN